MIRIAALILLSLAGCTSALRGSCAELALLPVGASEAAVIAAHGAPDNIVYLGAYVGPRDDLYLIEVSPPVPRGAARRYDRYLFEYRSPVHEEGLAYVISGGRVIRAGWSESSSILIGGGGHSKGDLRPDVGFWNAGARVVGLPSREEWKPPPLELR